MMTPDEKIQVVFGNICVLEKLIHNLTHRITELEKNFEVLYSLLTNIPEMEDWIA